MRKSSMATTSRSTQKPSSSLQAGFANNDEYLQEGGFSDTTNVKRFLYGYDGDGVRMAMAAGGASNIPRMSGLLQLTVSGAPGGEYGTFGRGDGLVVAGHNAASLWINEDGERFCAESARRLKTGWRI